jgi:hypothetical protein
MNFALKIKTKILDKFPSDIMCIIVGHECLNALIGSHQILETLCVLLGSVHIGPSYEFMLASPNLEANSQLLNLNTSIKGWFTFIKVGLDYFM